MEATGGRSVNGQPRKQVGCLSAKVEKNVAVREPRSESDRSWTINPSTEGALIQPGTPSYSPESTSP